MPAQSSIFRPSSLRLATSVAASLSAAALLPLAAQAQSQPAAASGTALPTVTVKEEAIDPNPNAEVGAPYKAKTSADSRHTKPLAEIPQTISVITGAEIQDAGHTDLKQILATQPGITLGTGENGNAFGDRIFIRGFEARNDVYIDGLRDPGVTSREIFAVEQIEGIKGPSGNFGGRGTTGGLVSLQSKRASFGSDFVVASGGIGTENFYRGTVDANFRLGDRIAVRVNGHFLQTFFNRLQITQRIPQTTETVAGDEAAIHQAVHLRLNV